MDEIYELSLEARRVLRDHVHVTPLITNYTLNALIGVDTYLKLENMQKTGAFKVRGAVFKIHRLISRENVGGVVAASSGNHAQGVAYAAKCFDIEALIVMPKTASSTKINATRSYGAKVVLHGTYYDEAYDKAIEIMKEKNYPFIHPYDDPEIIAGQATIAHEIFDQIHEPAYIIAPIGGGGLISGLAVVAKKKNPDTKVIGVEPRNAPSIYYRVKEGLSEVEVKPSIADAVVVKKPGELTSKIIEELVDDIVLVNEEDISYAINFLLERAKIVVEGAGALPVAAMLSNALKPEKGPVVVVISGGNIDPALLSRIIIHETAKDGRLVSIVGELFDKPGELGKVIDILAKYGLNIIDIKHDRWNPRTLPNKALLEIVFEAASRESVKQALEELRIRGYSFKLKDQL
ncbi:MAG: threonine ammonia-lyase [Desulfurococcales archaeon ex4484_58]|nr:MAG: threonine ammonia-lyase [Desulfurococcales archaeon ex4484_58]